MIWTSAAGILDGAIRLGNLRQAEKHVGPDHLNNKHARLPGHAHSKRKGKFQGWLADSYQGRGHLFQAFR
jgi:hypothetical protein